LPVTTSTDFFAAVITISSITAAAKSVIYGSRHLRTALHWICTVASLGSIGLSLSALLFEELDGWRALSAAALMGVALLILVGEAALDDIRPNRGSEDNQRHA
jgi:hypothetical protein